MGRRLHRRTHPPAGDSAPDLTSPIQRRHHRDRVPACLKAHRIASTTDQRASLAPSFPTVGTLVGLLYAFLASPVASAPDYTTAPCETPRSTRPFGGLRIRDAGYPAPPAQIRTCALTHTAPASGV